MRATETIYREMLSAYAKRRGGQLQEDCDLSVRLWAAAAQIQALEAQAEWVLGQSFPQTAAGVYLDRHGAMRGIVRQAPSRATGQLTFRLSNAQTGAVSVETGTVCMTEGTVRFRTTEPGTIPAGEISVTVAAEAVETGSSGNVGTGTVHVLTACPVAVTAVTNEKAFTGGLSEETDEELRQRILDSFQRLPNGANAAVMGCSEIVETQRGQQANQILLIHTTHASSVTVTVPNTGSTVSLAARSADGTVI